MSRSRITSHDRHVIAGAVASALVGLGMLHVSRVLTSPAHIRAAERRASLRFGSVSVLVHVADTRQRRRAGLMDNVPESDTGELFAWHSDAERHFWMWRTPAALDMIFLDGSGRVVDVLASVPPCYVKPCAVFSERAHYAVEVPAGFSTTAGVVDGMRVRGVLSANRAARS